MIIQNVWAILTWLTITLREILAILDMEHRLMSVNAIIKQELVTEVAGMGRVIGQAHHTIVKK